MESCKKLFIIRGLTTIAEIWYEPLPLAYVKDSEYISVAGSVERVTDLGVIHYLLYAFYKFNSSVKLITIAAMIS